MKNHSDHDHLRELAFSSEWAIEEARVRFASDTRINSNFLCSPFFKAQMTEAWKCLRQVGRLDDLALCIWRTAYLQQQQQQPAVTRHWKIYGDFFLVASFPRSSVSLRCLRFRRITVTRVFQLSSNAMTKFEFNKYVTLKILRTLIDNWYYQTKQKRSDFSSQKNMPISNNFFL